MWLKLDVYVVKYMLNFKIKSIIFVRVCGDIFDFGVDNYCFIFIFGVFEFCFFVKEDIFVI